MKVAMISPTRESEKAISGYSEHLVKALKKNGINADFLTYEAGSPKSFFKLLPQLKNYDIVHIQHEYNLLGGYGVPFFPIYLYFMFKRKYKLITTMHTALPLNHKFEENFLKTFFRKILYFFQNRIISKSSDLIFVHSDFFVPVLTEDYNVPKNKIIVLPQGIIENAEIIPKDKAKRKLGLTGPVYLVIGNLTPDSGLDIILNQADKIGKTILVVSSPVPVNDRKKSRLKTYLDSNVDFVKKNNFSKYVRFDIKPISDQMPRWWEYFSAADFVLQAYRGGIGSGIFTHAMATKTPVITSDIPFFRDIGDKYGCLKVVKKEEDYPKIIKESLSSKNYNHMKKEAARYLKENSWTAIAKKYKKIYDSLLE